MQASLGGRSRGRTIYTSLASGLSRRALPSSLLAILVGPLKLAEQKTD